ncbi:T9SS type B sorting domain-containing protein [Ferruginibacter sp.]|uniref:NHL domain-containing protein n=1 Tax=Ferruginibacter sp. TaxID=1940288 RepID=UPI002657ED11|nr:T9SS type B sorting domain-containing protein [Ferruginibacter sp.]
MPNFLKQFCLLAALLLIAPGLYPQLITTIAGNGTGGFSGDGGPALSAQLDKPVGMCFDAAGNMFIAEYGNQRIRKIDAVTGLTSTIAGNGTGGFSGDGGPAINAQLNHPVYLVTDKQNHLYISDYLNLRVRMVDLTTGIITTIAGNGTENYVSGARADQTGMLPYGLAFDNNGDLFISQRPGPFASYTTNIISKVNMLTGIVTTFAGNGQYIFSGDGGPALQAAFCYPMGMCFDASNNLYVADNIDVRIRKIDAITGIVTTVAGDGTVNDNAPDGTLATQVGISSPTDVKIDADGNLIYVDYNNISIRKVNMLTGVMSTLAGMSSAGFGADCVSPTSVPMGEPRAVAFDSKGNLCFTDQDYNRIRSIIPGTPSSITIAPSSSDVCLQNVVTFSAHTTGASAQAFYQWTKNGVNAGTNSDAYTDTFHKGDVVVCMLTPGTCGNTQVASAPYTLTGTFEVTPVVTIEATSTEICAGTAITFTATNVSGSLNPSFEWYINNQLAATGSTVFNSNTLKDGDIVQCIMRMPMCNFGTTKDYSNADTIRVYTSLHPTVGIAASSPAVCKGSPVTFIATVLETGPAPVYQWKINGASVGINNAIFQTAGLQNGDVVSCAITTAPANSCLPVQTVASNEIVMTIQEPVNPSLQIKALQTGLCQGDSVQLLAVVTPQIQQAVFKWQVNNTTVSGTNLYTVQHAADGDQISCSIDIGGCAVAPTITSNTIKLLVHPLPLVTLNPADTVVGAGVSVQLTGTVPGTGFNFFWRPADKLQSSTTLNAITVPMQTATTFELNVTSADGCTTVKEAIIKVNSKLYMPAAFTPNGDRKNDVFRIPPNVSFQLESFSIFDRWGNKIFSTSDISKGWDGTYMGKPFRSNSFIFLITGRDNKGIVKQKGSFLLIR